MGSCISCVGTPEEKAIKELAARNQAITKILFLGAGDSGKSTIIKQSVRTYGDKAEQEKLFNEGKQEEYKKIIKANLVVGTTNVLHEMSNEGKKLSTKALEAKQRFFEAVKKLNEEKDTFNLSNIKSQGLKLPQLFDIADDLVVIGEDEEFQAMVKRSNEFQLDDNYPLLLQKLKEDKKWSRKGYKNNDWDKNGWQISLEDALLARNRTTGIAVSNLEVEMKDNHTQKIQLLDVGGQRSERNKWINLMKGIDAVVFVVSLSEYNQKLFESEDTNRLDEALLLFDKYGNHEDIQNSPIILFLNKYDLFKKKYYIDKIPLVKPNEDNTTSMPPKVEDEVDDVCQKATNWFAEIFAAKVQDTRSLDDLFPHVTTALNPDNVKEVLFKVIDHLLTKHLLANGLFTPESREVSFAQGQGE